MAKAPTPALVHEGSPRGTPILFHIDKCEPKHDISDVEKRTWIQSETEHSFVCSLLSGIQGTLSDWGSPATNVVQLRRSPHLSKPSGTEPNIANLPHDNKVAEMQAGLPPGTPVPGSDGKGGGAASLQRHRLEIFGRGVAAGQSSEFGIAFKLRGWALQA